MSVFTLAFLRAYLTILFPVGILSSTSNRKPVPHPYPWSDDALPGFPDPAGLWLCWNGALRPNPRGGSDGYTELHPWTDCCGCGAESGTSCNGKSQQRKTETPLEHLENCMTFVHRQISKFFWSWDFYNVDWPTIFSWHWDQHRTFSNESCVAASHFTTFLPTQGWNQVEQANHS